MSLNPNTINQSDCTNTSMAHLNLNVVEFYGKNLTVGTLVTYCFDQFLKYFYCFCCHGTGKNIVIKQPEIARTCKKVPQISPDGK